MRVSPVLVMRPRGWRSPELCSLGTRPRYALTWSALAKRVTSSRVATNAAAVTGPIVGAVVSSSTTGSVATSSAMCRSAAAIAALIGASNARSGASASLRAAR